MTESKKTILVVEDEKSMLQILTDRLEIEGFNVVEARDGSEGLEMALEHHPDLIVLDVVMPKMDGAEMIKRLLKDVWGKNVPVVCLTNLEETPKSIKQAMKSHPNIVYVIKVHTRLDNIIEMIKAKLGS